MMWWERERLLTEKDKEAIYEAKKKYYADIDENDAETIHGKQILREMIIKKYRAEEWDAQMG